MMLISQYSALGDGLPDVSGLLSGSIPNRAIGHVNREVARVLAKRNKNERVKLLARETFPFMTNTTISQKHIFW